MNITILGAGAWGTAMAVHLAARHAVTLWARDAAQAATLNTQRVNQRYLADITLPAGINVTADLPLALNNATLVLAAVTTAGLRETSDAVEAEGVRRARAEAASSHLTLL